jgi:hypothetical protein
MDSFGLSDVVNRIEKEGLNIVIGEVEMSLKQLVLGYVIQQNRDGYYYPIPLLKELFFRDRDTIKTRLRGIILELKD